MRDIKKIVGYYVRKFGTRDPFEIADQLGILYQTGYLNFDGCYMFLKKHRYIFLNSELLPCERKMVMAHELAHAILHRKENCYFIRNKTFLSVNKIEIEANRFAAELLISDEAIRDNQDLTSEQFSRMLGYSEDLIRLKLQHA